MNTNWSTINNSLYKKFIFADFSSAFAFMTRVALLSEQQNHHPTWKNTWNTVEIWLSTHDAGDAITEKDFILSDSIDKLLSTPLH